MCCSWDYVEKSARQATDNNVTQCVHCPCFLTKARHTQHMYFLLLFHSNTFNECLVYHVLKVYSTIFTIFLIHLVQARSQMTWFTVCNTHSVSKNISRSYNFYCNWHTHTCLTALWIISFIEFHLNWTINVEGMERKQVHALKWRVAFTMLIFTKNHKSFNMFLYKSQSFMKLKEHSIHICRNLCLILPKAEGGFWMIHGHVLMIIYAVVGFVSHNGRKMLKIWAKFHVFS